MGARTVAAGLFALSLLPAYAAETAGPEMERERAQVDRAREKDARHHAAVQESATLDGMMVDVRTHDERMGQIAGGMGERMGRCSVPRTRGMMDEMALGISRHPAPMEEVGPMVEGRATCDRRVAEMHGMFDQMDGALDGPRRGH